MGPYIKPRPRPWEPEVVRQEPIRHSGAWSDDSIRVLCSCGWESDVHQTNPVRQYREHREREARGF